MGLTPNTDNRGQTTFNLGGKKNVVCPPNNSNLDRLLLLLYSLTLFLDIRIEYAVII